MKEQIKLIVLCNFCYLTDTTQLEDPRLQWRETQECMLKDYLAHAHDDLLVSEIVKCV